MPGDLGSGLGAAIAQEDMTGPGKCCGADPLVRAGPPGPAVGTELNIRPAARRPTRASAADQGVRLTKLRNIVIPCWLATFTLASVALAADPAWIEQAGGSVTRDAAGKIVAVDLRSSWVTDSDMPLLARMTDLQRLDLTLTRISDRGLRALKSAPALEDLNLCFAEQITDEGAAVVKNWPHLKRLNLRGTKITDSTLEFLAGVPRLEWLDIGWAQITDTGLEHLSTLTNLRWLAMGGNKLTDTALQFLRTMPQIEYLDLGGAQRTDSGLWSLAITRTGLRAVGSVTELRELSLAGTVVNAQGLQELKALAKLERLNLQGCRQLRDDAVGVLASFKQLRVLDVKDSGMTVQGVERLRAALPECRVLA